MPKPGDRPRPTTRPWFFRICCGLLHILLRLLRTTSPERFQRLARPVVRLFLAAAVSRRRLAAVMDAAFGDSWDEAARLRLARDVQRQCADAVVDSLLHIGHPERLGETLRVRGLDHLDAALSRGHGVIALGFHLGNFLLVGGALGLRGYSIHCLFRFVDDEKFMDVALRHSPSFFAGLIPSMPRRDAVRKILAVLRDNQIVLILGDNLKRGEVETRLFGRPVRSARGPVSLALRSGAAVLPVYLVRNEAGGLELVVEEALELTRTGDLQADLQANTDHIMELLEALVRRYPDQWYWLTAKIPPRDQGLSPNRADWSHAGKQRGGTNRKGDHRNRTRP